MTSRGAATPLRALLIGMLAAFVSVSEDLVAPGSLVKIAAALASRATARACHGANVTLIAPGPIPGSSTWAPRFSWGILR